MRKLTCLSMMLVVFLTPALLRAALPTISISPSSGTGWSQTFTVVASDTSGYTDIKGFHVLFNSSPSGKNACWIYFQTFSSGATVWLASDDASSWSSVAVSTGGGQDVTVENSQCSFSGSTTMWSTNGSTAVIITIPLTFKSHFAGTKDIFLEAASNSGQDTGYQMRGTWTVNLTSPGPDFSISVSPSSQTVTAELQTSFNVTVKAMNGFANQVDCTVSGLPPNTFTAGGQSNNGCGQYQTASSETITIYIDTTTSTPAGTYTLVFTGKSGTLSHSAKAALTVRSPTAPATSVAPSAGTGSNQTFTFTISDVNGYQDLQGIDILFNSSLSGTKACWMFTGGYNSELWLADDTASGWGAVNPGSTAVVQNSQCRIAGTGITYAASGNVLTIKIDIQFSSTFAGTKTIFMRAVNKQNVDSGYLARGTWTVP